MPMVNETQHFYNADEDLIITSDQGLQETYALPENQNSVLILRANTKIIQKKSTYRPTRSNNEL